jgi:hypothetical protein
MQLSLQPRIEVAFSFLDDVVVAEAGAFLDLPFTNVTISQLSTSTVDEDCNSSNGTSTQDTDFAQAFKNLTHIVPEVGLGVGLDFMIQAQLPEGVGIEASTEFDATATLLQTAFTLPTVCLAFLTAGSGSPGFTPAASAFSMVQASEASKSAQASESAHASATQGAKKGGSGTVVPPLRYGLGMKVDCLLLISLFLHLILL